MTEPKLMVLTWNDAWCEAGTEVSLKDVHETHKPVIIETVGWILLSDEEGVSIANEKTGPDTYRGRTFVLASMVISIKPYRVPRKRRTKAIRDTSVPAGTGDSGAEGGHTPAL